MAYGKRLTLCHALAQFDPQSQALIQLLMNEFQSFRSLSGTTERVTAITILQRARAVCLTGDSFDRFFQMYFHQTLVDSLEKRTVVLEEGDPPVTMRLRRQRSGAGLTGGAAGEDEILWQSPGSVCLWRRKSSCRCSREFPSTGVPHGDLRRPQRNADENCPVGPTGLLQGVLPEVRDLWSRWRIRGIAGGLLSRRLYLLLL